ncbi:MAG: DUF1697 domain-containing protein [Acidobacteriota bacterium]
MSVPRKQTYVAFLRGVNVGGKKPIRMKQLTEVLTAAGFRNVRTFIASGNVIFEASAKDPERIARKMEKHLLDALGYEITVIIRNVDELRAIIKRNPFKKPKPSADEMLFVTFLAEPTLVKPRLPLQSKTENMEVIALTDGAAFIVARRKKTGWFGFPHTFAEKEFRVPTTTRNWTTVVKIVAAAERE